MTVRSLLLLSLVLPACAAPAPAQRQPIVAERSSAPMAPMAPTASAAQPAGPQPEAPTAKDCGIRSAAGSEACIPSRYTAPASSEPSSQSAQEYARIEQRLRPYLDELGTRLLTQGRPTDLMRIYKKAKRETESYHHELDAIVKRVDSPGWATVAVARQGSVFDALRNSWAAARTGGGASEQQAFNQRRAPELDELAKASVRFYVLSLCLSDRFGVAAPEVAHAVRRIIVLQKELGPTSFNALASQAGCPFVFDLAALAKRLEQMP